MVFYKTLHEVSRLYTCLVAVRARLRGSGAWGENNRNKEFIEGLRTA